MQHTNAERPLDTRITNDARNALAAELHCQAAALADMPARLLALAKGRALTLEDLRLHARHLEALAARLDSIAPVRRGRRRRPVARRAA